MGRVFLHVDLDAFFVSVEQALDPALRGQPVIVGGRSQRGVVASASYEARRFGIAAGMPLTRARRLCPQAIFIAGRFRHYEEASAKFLAILADFTPDLEPAGIDEAYLDLTGFEPFYGPPRQAAQAIKDRVRRELSITASVGIAPSKVVAKVASDLEKPDGLVEVPPGLEATFLAPLPLARLPGAGPRAQELLGHLGLTTIGALAALPHPVVRQLLGLWGETLHRWAQGQDRRGIELPGPPKSISRSTTFPRDTLDPAFLHAVLRYLSERVGAQLRQEGRSARCVSLRVRYSDFETILRSRTLRQPVQDDAAISQEARRLLARALAERAKLVRLLGVGVSQLVEGGRQLALWEARATTLSRLLDGVRQKHGFAAIQVGETWPLRSAFPVEEDDYLLPTPALSR